MPDCYAVFIIIAIVFPLLQTSLHITVVPSLVT